MAMTEGSVSIDATGAATGTGAAKEVFDALDATIDYGTLTGTDLQGAKQRTADLCNAIAKIIPHITTNGEAIVSTSDTGLQRIPATPLSEDDECKAPGTEKYLAIR